MRGYTDGRCGRQISFLRRQFLQDGQLPFAEVLSKKMISQTLATSGVVWKERIYSPLVTLGMFLGQVLSADHSCRSAVARLIAHRVSQGQKPCSAETGAYCQARKRLPEEFFATTAREAGKTLPERFTVRETRIRVEQPGFRGHNIVVVTTLLDAEEVTAEDLAELYRARWNCELDLRSLKQTMQMDTLRCKTPELVRKEVWAHVLAYNLIRTVMAQAASKHRVEPRTISFKGAVQSLEAFQPLIAVLGERGRACRRELYDHLLEAIATHRVANRPGRFEPRLIKRRHGKYDLLTKPRHETKQLMLKALA